MENSITYLTKLPLIEFEKDGKHAYFDLKDNKWQFWGDISIDESAELLFIKLSEIVPKYFNIDKYLEDQKLLNK